MDPPQFMIVTGALGLEFALGKLVFAVMIGLGGGFAMQALAATGTLAEPLKARKTKSCCKSCGTDTLTGKPVLCFTPAMQVFLKASARRSAAMVRVSPHAITLAIMGS